MNKQKGSANVILIILVVLLVATVIYFAFIKKPDVTVQPINSSIPPQSSTEQSVTYVPSPSNFGTVVSYNSKWSITPQYYGSAAMEAEGKSQLVGYMFTLPDGALLTWGGNQSACSSSEPGFNVSSGRACVKGLTATIGHASARASLSTADLNAFGDFVVKNQ